MRFAESTAWRLFVLGFEELNDQRAIPLLPPVNVRERHGNMAAGGHVASLEMVSAKSRDEATAAKGVRPGA